MAVSTFDPVVKALPEEFKDVRLADDVYAAADRADAVVPATEWLEFRLIDPAGLRRVMRGDLVDGRKKNCLPANNFAGSGLHLVGLAGERDLTPHGRCVRPGRGFRPSTECRYPYSAHTATPTTIQTMNRIQVSAVRFSISHRHARIDRIGRAGTNGARKPQFRSGRVRRRMITPRPRPE